MHLYASEFLWSHTHTHTHIQTHTPTHTHTPKTNSKSKFNVTQKSPGISINAQVEKKLSHSSHLTPSTQVTANQDSVPLHWFIILCPSVIIFFSIALRLAILPTTDTCNCNSCFHCEWGNFVLLCFNVINSINFICYHISR